MPSHSQCVCQAGPGCVRRGLLAVVLSLMRQNYLIAKNPIEICKLYIGYIYILFSTKEVKKL